MFALLWWAVLGLSRCYETRFLGSGNEEFKRVGNASLRGAGRNGVTQFPDDVGSSRLEEAEPSDSAESRFRRRA